jgi:hypothetical protein
MPQKPFVSVLWRWMLEDGAEKSASQPPMTVPKVDDPNPIVDLEHPPTSSTSTGALRALLWDVNPPTEMEAEMGATVTVAGDVIEAKKVSDVLVVPTTTITKIKIRTVGQSQHWPKIQLLRAS